MTIETISFKSSLPEGPASQIQPTNGKKRGRPRKVKETTDNAETKNIVKGVENTSGINPTHFKVLVKPRDIEEKIGNIIIPKTEAEKLHYAAMDGVLIAASPLAFRYEVWPEGSKPPKAGDKVLFAKYAGMRRKGKDGVEYIVMNDVDICAVLDE